MFVIVCGDVESAPLGEAHRVPHLQREGGGGSLTSPASRDDSLRLTREPQQPGL